MKQSTKIIKEVDNLGRFQIPNTLRKTMGFKAFEILVEGDDIILRKQDVEYCIFCEDKKELVKYEGRYVCRKCIEKLNQK
ncbi:MAG: AbrB/MazE/SpoVT family DNA-binding domain-containing protein [Clostridia bacterium]|nr:AbrB/MazE/SpoVT family DNA-binding domain-containing protein [Clostridia bacterium]